MEQITIYLDGTEKSDVFKVQLKSGSKNSMIGFYSPNNGGIFFTNRNENNIFKKNNSIGLNLDLLKNKDFKFKWILVHYKNGITHEELKLITTRETFLLKGQKMVFLKPMPEPQLFLPISEFCRDIYNSPNDSFQLELF